jgi:hypothetical protein
LNDKERKLMSYYKLPDFYFDTPPYTCVQDAFCEKELKKISDYCELIAFREKAHSGKIGGNREDKNVRDSNVAWIELNGESEWFMKRFINVIQRANRDYWNYELDGHHPLQYTTYENGGKYDWHIDAHGSTRPTNRKLSASMLLSDPSEFEGGEFMICDNPNEVKVLKPKVGDIIIFPSTMIHKVNNV